MKLSSKLILGLTFGFAAFLVFIIVGTDSGGLPRFLSFYKQIPYGDKIGHFVLMGFLAFLANLALKVSRVRIGPLHVLKGSLIVLVLVTLEEVSQIYFPLRTFSQYDLMADYAGIFFIGHAALFFA